MPSLLVRNVQGMLGRDLKARAARNGRTAEEEHLRILRDALSEPTPSERQRFAVARRLNWLLARLNDGVRSWPQMTVPRMAECLGLNTAAELEACFLAEQEAPFDLLDRISLCFGLCSDWLKFGHGRPFEVRGRSVRRLHLSGADAVRDGRTGLDRLLAEESPQALFFVRSLDDVGYATIFLQVTPWKYVGFRDGWHVSGHVGATGQRQLAELRKLLGSVEQKGLRVEGRDLPPDVFRMLYDGEVFPGSVLWNDEFRSQWALDFICLEQPQPQERHNPHGPHGEGFQKAQSGVREHLQHEGKG